MVLDNEGTFLRWLAQDKTRSRPSAAEERSQQRMR
jgi:hypothetical protein